MASSSRITIELWDSKLAPLSSEERASVAWMQDLCSTRPVPAKFQEHRTPKIRDASRPNTPVQNSFLRNANSRFDLASTASSSKAASALGRRPASNRGVPVAGTSAHGSLITLPQPAETAQQFSDWISKVESEIEAEQERDYRLHLATVNAYLEGCDEVLDTLDESRGLLREMDANYKFVEENSRALQAACEDMLDEQKHLLEVTDAIGSRLEHFKELERATKILNLPGDTLVLDPDFLDLIDRLDYCLSFLRENRNFKDAEVYLIRFQQCLTRAMTLIKMYFTSQLSSLVTSISNKIAGKSLGDMAIEALLYSKFSSAAQHIKPLIFELEKRASQNADEYAALLAECHASWFAARNALLSDRITQEVSSMEPYTADLIKLARSGCNYLRSVCISEWDLYGEYFSSTGKEELYVYLESLCDKLCDYLRPRILHEPKLDTLCELCTIIQALMSLDPGHPSDADGDEQDGISAMDPLTPPATHSTHNPFFSAPSTSTPTNPTKSFGEAQQQYHQSLGHLQFSRLLQGILQDAQTRLVFRSQAIIQSEVMHYQPSDADLDYPNKLKGTNRQMSLWPASLDEHEEDREGSSLRLPDSDIQDTWYPTLRKTLWVLTRLHTYVKDAIFEDIAGETVTLCRQSLVMAAQRLASKPGVSQLDSQLFSIRHLLILKEMIRSIDLVHVQRDPAFFSVADALSGLLWSSTGLLNPSGLFEMASKGMPNFGETMKDAKIELDIALKTVCEEFIVQAGLSITAPIRAFVTQAQSYLATPASGPNTPVIDLTAQPWASGDQIKSLHNDFVNAVLERSAQEIMSKLDTWLSDESTLTVLIPPIQEEVLQTYKQFYSLIRAEYDFEISNTLLTPSAISDRLQKLSGRTETTALSKKG